MNKKEFLKKLENKVFLLDGAMGTMLQAKNFKGCPDELNLTHPKIIKEIHCSYRKAGAELILTNTFGANRIKLTRFGLEKKVKQINEKGVKLARESCPDAIIVGDIGPIGDYIEPIGKLTFDEVYESYKEQAKGLSKADMILVETISDIKVLKAALIAVREEFEGPLISSMTIQKGRTITGTDIETYVTIAERLADIIGVNCSDGPEGLYETGKKLAKLTNKPLFLKPNAGLPKIKDDKTLWDYPIKKFGNYTKKYVNLGASIVGGCCGTTPEFIREAKNKIKGLKPKKRDIKIVSRLSSRTKTLIIKPTIIAGERINPTNKPLFINDLKKKKTDYLKNQASQQVEEGAEILDVNVGVVGLDEKELLPFAIDTLQNIIDVPLILDSSNPEALEEGLKKCEGKPLINSFNATTKSIETILPLAKKYGASIIGLCLDDKGIPNTINQRVSIAKKLITAAKKYNVPSQDIFIDPLVMTQATNENIKELIIESIKKIKKLGCNTLIGLSNISHGLDNRPTINSEFFKKIKPTKLDIVLMNPIDRISSIKLKKKSSHKFIDYDSLNETDKIKNAIIYGNFEKIISFTKHSLKTLKPMKINEIIIKSLTIVGDKFGKKEIFLPEVLSSAKTAKTAFKILKPYLKKEGGKPKGKILFATVENDIHDIGKNIVIALLESNNYEVKDLGVNVSTERIISETKSFKPNILALSALMTTTAIEMKTIIEQLKKNKIGIPVIVGGAVITHEYANEIQGNYGKDALNAVKLVENLIDEKFAISVELFPSKKLDLQELNTLKNIDFFTLTQGAGGNKTNDNIDFIKEIKKNISVPLIPHIIARDHSKKDIAEELNKLKKIGIDKLLVVRGDLNKDHKIHSDFKYAYELIDEVSKQGFYVLVAGHPEYSTKKSKEFIKKKINLGAKEIITQIIFDVNDYKKYSTILRKENINVPIHAGVFPLTNKKQIEIIEKLGVKIPEKIKENFERLSDKEAYEIGIKNTIKLIKNLKKIRVNGVHIFSMNDIKTTKKIIDKT